jgi:hypothetical protein
MRQRMGYVFQGAALFDSLTVWENVVISLYEHGERNEQVLDAEARRVLSAVRLLPELTDNGSPAYKRIRHSSGQKTIGPFRRHEKTCGRGARIGRKPAIYFLLPAHHRTGPRNIRAN